MKTEIKKRVKEIIEKHAQIKKEYGKIDEKIEAWRKDPIYSTEHKEEQIKYLEQEKESGLRKVDIMFNEQLENIVEEEKEAIFGDAETKPVDYQNKISNALEFIKLSGKNLTDKQAFELLKPFQGDFQTMQLFHSVIANTVIDGMNQNFEKTFQKTNKLVAIHNKFDLVEGMAGNVFDSLNKNSLVTGTKIGVFLGHVEAIDEMVNSIEA